MSFGFHSLSTLTFKTVGVLHDKLVINRRIAVLSDWFAKLVPERARVLDVGCGDGLISSVLKSKRPDISVQGIDVFARSRSHIEVQVFDGSRIPFDDHTFDVVLFSDVLHHTDDPTVLLREARRVARHSVLIKDHNRSGLGAAMRLRTMDWVGNARFDVALPYNYWTQEQWQYAWHEIGLRPERIVTQLALYPASVNWLLEQTFISSHD